MANTVHQIVLACTNANGAPDFAFVQVDCSEEMFNEGEHYKAAEKFAQSELGYEGPFVCFDEKDMQGGLGFLKGQFVWESASTVTI